MLQWGRDHSIAETSDSTACADKPDQLQWGRDHSIAETAGRECLELSITCHVKFERDSRTTIKASVSIPTTLVNSFVHLSNINASAPCLFFITQPLAQQINE